MDEPDDTFDSERLLLDSFGKIVYPGTLSFQVANIADQSQIGIFYSNQIRLPYTAKPSSVVADCHCLALLLPCNRETRLLSDPCRTYQIHTLLTRDSISLDLL